MRVHGRASVELRIVAVICDPDIVDRIQRHIAAKATGRHMTFRRASGR